MCPMCSRPVTFGGGNSSVNTGRVSPGGGVGTEKSFSLTQCSAQRVSIAPGSYALGRSWAMVSKKPSAIMNRQSVNADGSSFAGCQRNFKGRLLTAFVLKLRSFDITGGLKMRSNYEGVGVYRRQK